MLLVFILVLAWLVWSPLAAWAQYQRGGNPFFGAIVGLIFGPVGLLVANYSGGRQCPECRSRISDRRATRCAQCGARLA